MRPDKQKKLWTPRDKTGSAPSLNDAIQLAAMAHDGQVDKGGAPYILHPLRVMMCLRTEEERIVGVLHDVAEDTFVGLESIKFLGYSDAVVQALDLLTRRDNEPYKTFIERISTSYLASRVKIQDLLDNTDLSRLKEITPQDEKRYRKYMDAMIFLTRTTLP